MNREKLIQEVIRLSIIIEEKTELTRLNENHLVLLSIEQLREMITILTQRINRIDRIKTKNKPKSHSIFSDEARLVANEIEREYQDAVFDERVRNTIISNEFDAFARDMNREEKNKKKK